MIDFQRENNNVMVSKTDIMMRIMPKLKEFCTRRKFNKDLIRSDGRDS